MQIRIYSYNDRIAGGVVTPMQDKREIPFCGLDQAVLIIEEILDRNRQMEMCIRDRFRTGKI